MPYGRDGFYNLMLRSFIHGPVVSLLPTRVSPRVLPLRCRRRSCRCCCFISTLLHFHLAATKKVPSRLGYRRRKPEGEEGGEDPIKGMKDLAPPKGERAISLLFHDDCITSSIRSTDWMRVYVSLHRERAAFRDGHSTYRFFP